ncbi:MAG: methyltransferase/methylesterase, CheR/CheB with sensor [Planctomycetaceae bacterium]|nr:methyltransferase/methylesterase, CheR/CheB with sensor [Planctomycetaceae bacterium]
MLEIAAEEQRRIGQELHDGTGQELTGLTLIAGTLVDLLNKLPRRPTGGDVNWLLEDAALLRLRQTASRLTMGLAEANRHVQQLSHGIIPVQIEVEGLRSALEELAAATEIPEKVACHFECPVPVTVANNTTATYLYRIAQEAVNNALRHSQADQIRIALLEVE